MRCTIENRCDRTGKEREHREREREQSQSDRRPQRALFAGGRHHFR